MKNEKLRCPLCGSWYGNHGWHKGELCNNQAWTGHNPRKCSPLHPCSGRLVSAEDAEIQLSEDPEYVQWRESGKPRIRCNDAETQRLMANLLAPVVTEVVYEASPHRPGKAVNSFDEAVIRATFDPPEPDWDEVRRLRSIPYAEYLQTDHWIEVRNWIREWWNYTCQRCGNKREGRHLNVHHLTYARRGHEHDEDLELLCGDCHQKEHGIKCKRNLKKSK